MNRWAGPMVSLAVFLGLLIFVLGTSNMSSGDDQRHTGEPALDLPVEAIHSVVFEVTPQRFVLEAQREGTGTSWILTEPPGGISLNQSMTRILVKSVTRFIPLRIIDDPEEDLGHYGLADPSGKVIVNLNDGSSLTLYIGDLSPVSEGPGLNYYGMLSDRDDVFVLSYSHMEVLSWGPTDIRQRDLFRFAGKSDVSSIELAGPDHAYQLVRTDDPAVTATEWISTAPYTAPVNTGSVQSFLDVLRAMRAIEFVDDLPENLDDYGLGHPSMVISLGVGSPGLGQEHVETLLVGSQVEGLEQVYVMRDDEQFVYAMHMGLLDELPSIVSLSDSRPVLGLTMDNLTSASWLMGGSEGNLEKKPGSGQGLLGPGWSLALDGEDDVSVDASEV